MVTTRRRTAGALVSVVLAAAALAGCGDDDENGSESAAGGSGLTEVTVGLVPINAVAPIYLGIEEGIFEREGLDVKVQVAQGGAAIVPSVVSGSTQFGFSNLPSLLIAHSKGLPVRGIAPGESSAKDPKEDNTALMVLPDSGIAEPKDLEGKTIGINALTNIAQLTVLASLKKQGVDVATLKFVEIPFPDMLGAVQNKRVDVGFFNEPFTTLARGAGLTEIDRPYSGAGSELPIGPYFTSEKYLAENGDVVEKFVRALDEATAFAAENPDAVRDIVLTFTKTSPEVAEKMGLPHFATTLDAEPVTRVADLMVEHGFLESVPDVDAFIATPGG